MYRAVALAPEDRDFHRFLWREKATDPVVDYRMTRVTFGIASAPFLATNSVLHLAEQNESELPLAAKAVKESFYVDDGLPSVETKQEAILLHHQLQDLFNRGGFKLHKWDSNWPEVLNLISPEIRSSKSTSNLGNSDNFVKTLGMEYNSSQDHFRFSATDLSAEESSITKREVLSDSAKIFDLLGLISCVTILPKIIFQRLWEQGTAWDEPLPPDIQKEWLNRRTQPPEISAICIPCCYTPVGSEIVDRQLIGFSDASEKAYCGVVYLKSFKQAQAKMFPDAVETLQKKKPLPLSHSLQPLNPFLDADGLLRVGGRLSQSQKDYHSCHPLILHGRHHLMSLIIQSEHKRLCHAGPKLTLGSLQDLYHIVGARRAVRKCTHQCVTCQHASPKITTQLMGQVPAARLLPSFANERVSVDYAGPLTLKIGTTRRPTYCKAYVAIFVCLAIESCHIELVSNLKSEAFLAAFRPFVSRKGKPTEIWSESRNLSNVLNNQPHKNLL